MTINTFARAAAGALALALAAGHASAGPIEFHFDYAVEDLRSPNRIKGLYSDLQQQARRQCEAAALNTATCTGRLVDQVVVAIDDPGLTRHHATQSASLVPAQDRFLFHYVDRELRTLSATRKLYSRLNTKAGEYCVTHPVGLTPQVCSASLVERMVRQIGDRGLSRYHHRRAPGTVSVADPVM